MKIVKNGIAVVLELTWEYPLSEVCSKQTRAVCRKSISPSLLAVSV